jgi:hypothetical protein
MNINIQTKTELFPGEKLIELKDEMINLSELL